MEMPYLKLFYWSGVIFWGLTAVFFSRRNGEFVKVLSRGKEGS